MGIVISNYNDGRANFPSEIIYSTVSSPSSLNVADFYDDNRTNIIITRLDMDNNYITMTMLLNAC